MFDSSHVVTNAAELSALTADDRTLAFLHELGAEHDPGHFDRVLGAIGGGHRAHERRRLEQHGDSPPDSVGGTWDIVRAGRNAL